MSIFRRAIGKAKGVPHVPIPFDPAEVVQKDIVVSQGVAPVKSYNAWAVHSGTRASNNDLPLTNRGMALAAATIIAIARSLGFWSTFIGGLESVIRNIVTDEITARSTDRVPQHPLYEAFQFHRTQYKRPFLPLVVTTDKLYGETFAYKMVNEFDKGLKLRWLNPLSVQIESPQGWIEHYRYISGSQNLLIPPETVAYRIHGFDAFNDLRGSGNVRPIMEAANLELNLKRHLTSFFRNSALPTVLVSPRGDDTVLSKTQIDDLTQWFEMQHMGSGNQWKPGLPPVAIQVDQFDQPDIDKQYALHEPIMKEIFMSMEVPPTLAGDPSMTKYHDGIPVMRNWGLLTGLPYARDLAGWINDELMPFVDPKGNSYFEFLETGFQVLNEDDRLDSEIISNDLQSGIISLGEARTKRGYEPETKDFDELYMVDGVPMPLDVISEYWKHRILIAPSVFNTGLLTGAPLPQPVAPDQVVPTGDPENPDGVTIGESDKSHHHDHDLPLYAGDDLFPDEDIILKRLQDEIQTWKRFYLNRVGRSAGRAFESSMLPLYIKRLIEDRLETTPDTAPELAAMFNDIWLDPEVKSQATYRKAIRKAARDLWNGRSTSAEFIASLQRTINKEYKTAFTAGVQRGGLQLSDLKRDELHELDDLIDEEIANVPDLLVYIQKAKENDDIKIGDVRKRVDLWVNRYDRVEQRGFLVAQRDARLKWVWDAAKEHCADCKRLNGRVYRASTWRKIGIEPRSPKLKCFGIHCGCKWVKTTDAITQGRRPRI